METPSSQEITQLLQAWSGGDQAALEELVPLVRAELHRLARHYMANLFDCGFCLGPAVPPFVSLSNGGLCRCVDEEGTS